jgi:hypothetical protein
VRDAGGLFSVHNKKKISGWFTKWIIPYGFSSILAGVAAHLLEGSSELATIGSEWLAENAGYYLAVWYCQRFSQEEKLFGSSKDSIMQLILVEAFDSIVRLSLFWLAHQLPAAYRPIGAFIATCVADVSFALALNKSRQLLEICYLGAKGVKDFLSSWPSRPEPLVLNF